MLSYPPACPFAQINPDTSRKGKRRTHLFPSLEIPGLRFQPPYMKIERQVNILPPAFPPNSSQIVKILPHCYAFFNLFLHKSAHGVK